MALRRFWVHFISGTVKATCIIRHCISLTNASQWCSQRVGGKRLWLPPNHLQGHPGENIKSVEKLMEEGIMLMGLIMHSNC